MPNTLVIMKRSIYIYIHMLYQAKLDQMLPIDPIIHITQIQNYEWSNQAIDTFNGVGKKVGIDEHHL